ncbi:3-phosphoshikimate 1-carboxyvinyltransferase/cytidylate kinase [Nitrosomonas sp. Nm51]|uniref:(d)CMP kinase n=1 Tax=Nitrosomonas sp. Nm51 TaxID=133720 RepID=UPI0008D372FB|nr:(d)CMP kinase [Nitrosomonas sp. Nm51]SER39070.1 3-phosphoshikimate 1-carboxyvinyltransferase/cytidylate kinase [Nitrosomonas sp. Nm51]
MVLNNSIPVVAIDGPSASGKGTVAQLVAKTLGFHYLDSGALYRLVALKALQTGVRPADEIKLVEIALNLDAVFKGEEIYLDNTRVTEKIRTEECGKMASQLASYPRVREALIVRQRSFRQSPGLVTDGRDMGSVIFPDAILKVFLTASPEARAERRYKQLIEKGINANIADLQRDILKRDERDSSRSVAPLRQNTDARLLDTTSLSILQAQNSVLEWYREYCANERV